MTNGVMFNIAFLSFLSEFTTMAGRRLRDAVKRHLKSSGNKEMSGEIHIVIAGLANGYSQYVTTFEEYQAQIYEVKAYQTVNRQLLVPLNLYLMQWLHLLGRIYIIWPAHSRVQEALQISRP